MTRLVDSNTYNCLVHEEDMTVMNYVQSPLEDQLQPRLSNSAREESYILQDCLLQFSLSDNPDTRVLMGWKTQMSCVFGTLTSQPKLNTLVGSYTTGA